MARKEFPRSVRVAVIKRATKQSVVFCEKCGAMAKTFEIDHANPDGLTGEPTLANAVLLCSPCHKEKTAVDVEKIARAKRREANHLGAKPIPPRRIKSKGFEHVERQPKAGRARVDKSQIPPLPRRNIFTGEAY